jgi:hypothetical protein
MVVGNSSILDTFILSPSRCDNLFYILDVEMRVFLEDHGEDVFKFDRYYDGTSYYSNGIFELVVKGSVRNQETTANDLEIDAVYDLINEEWVD